VDHPADTLFRRPGGDSRRHPIFLPLAKVVPDSSSHRIEVVRAIMTPMDGA
jgi:hypothetical protein